MNDRIADDRKTEVLRLHFVEGLSTRAIAKKRSEAQ